MHGRQRRLAEKLQDIKSDIAIIQSPVHIFYYTDVKIDPHERFFLFVYDCRHTTSYLFVPELDYEKAEKRAKVDVIIPIADTDDGYSIVKETLPTNINSLAIEKDTMTVQQLEQVQTHFDTTRIKSIEAFIKNERLYKSESEIKKIKKAIEITERGLDYITEFVKIGMTEIEIKQELELYVYMIGADAMAFDTLVLSGENSSLPHGVSGSREIKLGDFLLFDFGVVIDGYRSDITRTFIVGEGTTKQREVYKIVKEANERAIRAAKIAKPIKEIDQAARSYIEAVSFGDFFIHRTGHGLGLEVHEQPSIHGHNKTLLKEGMLFTVEPGIYIPNLGGVRIEDNVYINEFGETEILTTFTKELMFIKGS